jgi:aconitate hydratase
MMRGTFANIRIRNQMVPGVEGGVTKPLPDGERCRSTTRPCATRPTGRRWSSSPARNTAPARRATGRPRARKLLGVRAVIAESFERIHRSNLVGMGVLPLQLSDGRMARFPVRCRIDTPTELEYFKAGGVMPFVLRNLASA